MGAFCVFGIRRSICKKVAEKKTPTSVGSGKDKRELTITEWAEKRDAMAAHLFETETRLVRVSPELDTPQFCVNWLKADPSNVRDAVIKVRGPKRDKNGDVVTRNGAPVETWLNYEDECKRLKIPAVKLVLPTASLAPVVEAVPA